MFDRKKAVDEILHKLEDRLHGTYNKAKITEHDKYNKKELIVSIFDMM